jgi:putative transposon-encoded protein
MAPKILECLKVLGPLLLAMVVAVATWQFQKWQTRLAKQKLRHDLYDRRLAIYVVFRDLLLALPDKSDEEIRAALRKASIARFEAPFLFGDPKIQEYLEAVCREVAEDVIGNINYREAVREAGAMADPDVARELLERVTRLGSAKLDLPKRHVGELTERFGKFLNLTDFWK